LVNGKLNIGRRNGLSCEKISRTRGKFDYINLAQSVQDGLVEAEIIEDDNCKVLCPIFVGYDIDKENPRCDVIIYPNTFDTLWP
jgi:hypothetical protein